MKFKLNAGRTATYQRGGSSARPASLPPWHDDNPAPITPIRQNPRDYEAVPLVCGCTIPWPVVAMLHSHGKQVQCDSHGWQRVTLAAIADAKRKAKKCQPPGMHDQLPSTDACPF